LRPPLFEKPPPEKNRAPPKKAPPKKFGPAPGKKPFQAARGGPRRGGGPPRLEKKKKLPPPSPSPRMEKKKKPKEWGTNPALWGVLKPQFGGKKKCGKNDPEAPPPPRWDFEKKKIGKKNPGPPVEINPKSRKAPKGPPREKIFFFGKKKQKFWFDEIFPFFGGVRPQTGEIFEKGAPTNSPVFSQKTARPKQISSQSFCPPPPPGQFFSKKNRAKKKKKGFFGKGGPPGFPPALFFPAWTEGVVFFSGPGEKIFPPGGQKKSMRPGGFFLFRIKKPKDFFQIPPSPPPLGPLNGPFFFPSRGGKKIFFQKFPAQPLTFKIGLGAPPPE